MGRLITGGGFKQNQAEAEKQFFSSIHRARVHDMNIPKGTISVIVEGTRIPRNVLMPLMGLSVDPSDTEGTQASWGRYIPQRGDMVLVGYDSNGEIYSLGYHATYYKGLDTLDAAREDRGGIGWGEASGMNIKPGDWHYKSARGCQLYLGDKAFLKAGPQSLVFDKKVGDTTLKTLLFLESYGERSECRMGSVKRMVLPTDPEETPIPSAVDPTHTAQEWNNVMKRGSLANPLGLEMARTSQGEVIDELTFLPMVVATAYPGLAQMPPAGFTRRLDSVSDDATGAINMYAKVVDNLGNVGVNATTATMFQWFTPLAEWNVMSLKWSVVAMESIGFTAGTTFDVIAPAGTNITSASTTVTSADIKLGGAGAVSFALKGTEFTSALTSYLVTSAAAFTKIAADPALAALMDPATIAALTAAATASGVLAGLLPSHLSAITKIL